MVHRVPEARIATFDLACTANGLHIFFFDFDASNLGLKALTVHQGEQISITYIHHIIPKHSSADGVFL